MPMHVNSTVTRVAEPSDTTAPGSSDDWDTPGVDSPSDAAAGAGTQKWAGSIHAYYREKVERLADGSGGVNVLTRRTLYLDTADVELVTLDTDDVITFTARGQTMTGTARTLARAMLDGIPRPIQTTRVELDDA